MATELELAHSELLAGLDAPDWSVTLQAVAVADTRIRGSIVGDLKVDEVEVHELLVELEK